MKFKAEVGKALDLIDKGHFEEGVELLHKLESKESLRAAYELGLLYHNGIYFEQNRERAFNYFIQLHRLDYFPATLMAASYYDNGYLGKKDYKNAFLLYEIAAIHGKQPVAWRRLGVFYLTGRGVEQDYNEAERCFKIAAQHGDPQAMYNLGLIYKKGLGVEADAQAALHWYLKAAEEGEPKSMLEAAKAFHYGHGVTADPHEAIYWYEKTLESSDSMEAAKGLYTLLIEDETDDKQRALELLNDLVLRGDPEAAFNLGMHYLQGDGVEADSEKALIFIRQSADDEYPPALYTLGILHHGKHIAKADQEYGLKLIRKAAEMHYQLAIEYLNNTIQ